MARKGFYFDMTACVGCKACQIACKDKMEIELKSGSFYREVSTYETGAYPTPGLYHYSSSCNHCENPACAAACPVGAMYKEDDGTVQHDDTLCIGCQACIDACPYQAPQYQEEENIVKKCTMCKELTDQGLNPVCVDACPMRALEWGDLDELKEKHKSENLVRELKILPDASLTEPSILINARVSALEEEGRFMPL